MAELNLVFELNDKKSIDEIAKMLQQRIRKMDMVEEVDAVVETSEKVRVLTGVEIVAAIGVTVLVIKSGRHLLKEVRKFVNEVKGLMSEIGELRNVYVDIAKRRVPIDKLGPDDLAELTRQPRRTNRTSLS